MKPFKFSYLLIFACLISLCSCDSCDDDTDLTTLPPETQTGANTFGCYVNGELFVAEKGFGPFGGRFLSGSYSRQSKKIVIAAYGRFGKIGIGILNPVNNHYLKISSIDYSNHNDLFYYQENVGNIYFSKIDTINKIVSGSFYSPIPIKYHPVDYIVGKDTVVTLTEGRFDIKLEMLEN